ncbi:carbohydrate sulfotransferase 4-like [Pecten maximus]|uniref:carbohydrate sulfotransferase 4-like n=1 Tax=Pecten maximus TaxID=6579 RepID=UPI00145913B5|nr:carbohydrate sulfotransferase 4-like [Pecten maximus]
MNAQLGVPTALVGKPTELPSSTIKTYNLLLIGYLRGGTTLLGEILGLRNDSFYVYEPLHKMAEFEYFKAGYVCSMNNESCRKANETTAMDIIRAIYRCDFHHYQDQLRIFQHMKSRGLESINDRKWKLAFVECHGEWRGCPESYQSRCSSRSSIVSKVPRLSVGLASKLLDTFSNLKIIHLVRDPRGIMNSRSKLHWTPVPEGAISLCKKMKDDYFDSKKIKEVYHERIFTLSYENITKHPVETLKEIYNLAGYNFDAAEEVRVAKRTSSSTSESPSNTYRQNSSKTADAWRKQIPKNVLSETNKACSSLYPLLGYPII